MVISVATPSNCGNGYEEDPVGYQQRLNTKFQPDIIRGTLAFAGLYQVPHEMLKHAVLDRFESSIVSAWTPTGGSA